jgi:hypothetical protein
MNIGGNYRQFFNIYILFHQTLLSLDCYKLLCMVHNRISTSVNKFNNIFYFYFLIYLKIHCQNCQAKHCQWFRMHKKSHTLPQVLRRIILLTLQFLHQLNIN